MREGPDLNKNVFLIDSQEHGYKADDEEGEKVDENQTDEGEQVDAEADTDADITADTKTLPPSDFFQAGSDLAVILDEETTGKNTQTDSIIQLAAKVLEPRTPS